jgi:hypothetical protein
MTTGLELDTFQVLRSLATNTKIIATELATIRGILELIYKNGLNMNQEKK